MSNFLQIKVPHAVRTVLKAWARDFRNGPTNHPAHPGEAFVSEMERLARASATATAVSRLFLGMLAARATMNSEEDMPEIDDARLRKNMQAIIAEAHVILDWCDGFLICESRPEMIVVHFPQDGDADKCEERTHV